MKFSNPLTFRASFLRFGKAGRGLALGMAAFLLLLPSLHAQTYSVWALNETAPSGLTGPRLLAFQDYTSASTSTAADFGQLVWNNGGTITPFAGGAETNAEAMAVNSRTGMAWFVVNPATGGFTTPRLFTVNLSTLVPSSQLVLTSVGTLTGLGAVEALAYNEVNNMLYAVATDAGSEEFWRINPGTGATSLLGSMTGSGHVLDQTDGLDIVHTYDGLGNPLTAVAYAYDQNDNHLYTINLANGAITGLVNSAAPSSTDIETIAWDPIAGRMLAMDNGLFRIQELSLTGNTMTSHSTYVQQGLTNSASTTDLEGSAFYSHTVPEPGGAVLVLMAACALQAARRRTCR